MSTCAGLQQMLQIDSEPAHSQGKFERPERDHPNITAQTCPHRVTPTSKSAASWSQQRHEFWPRVGQPHSHPRHQPLIWDWRAGLMEPRHVLVKRNTFMTLAGAKPCRHKASDVLGRGWPCLWTTLPWPDPGHGQVAEDAMHGWRGTCSKSADIDQDGCIWMAIGHACPHLT